VRAVVEGFRVRDLPLSAIHLDIDYMDGFRVFTVDPRRFPHFATLARDLETEGIALVTILDPGVKRDTKYAVYQSGRANRVFCTLPDGREMHAPVWPGWCAFPDFTNPQTRDWWGNQYPPLLEANVGGVWHDMNEPATFVAWGDPTLPQAVRHSMEGRGGDHAQAHNLFGLLMNRAGHEALRRLRPDRRPFILTRSGWSGVQRYAWTWTGDVETSWRSLRQTIPTMLGLALSGISYSGPDIGGFGGAPSAELYIRWFQLAAFLPFFRTHSSKVTPRREPWSFGPEALAIVREYLDLRYRLLPYFYTLAWEASTKGHPFVRPLFWLDDRDQSLWDVQDAFLLGDSLLVAPVLQPGATSREVTLPPGVWYDFHDERQYRGPGPVTIGAPLERVPVLARAGTVIPIEDSGAAAREARLVLHLYAGANGGALLYSDAGDGYGPLAARPVRAARG
jgi:alpha-glucosidase